MYERPRYTECIWCGGLPLTWEDVIPNWLRKTWVFAPDATRRLGRTYGDRSVLIGRARRINQAELRVRAVCKPCNGGWMSTLEARAKPIVGPLTRGEAVEIPPTARATIATWATKTAIMYGARVGVLPAERFRREFTRTWEPPARCTVHIAHLEIHSLRLRVEPLRWGPSDLHPARSVEGLIAMMALDLLGIVVFVNPSPSFRLQLPSSLWQVLHPVWPVDLVSQTWPPDLAVSVDDLDAILTRLIAFVSESDQSR